MSLSNWQTCKDFSKAVPVGSAGTPMSDQTRAVYSLYIRLCIRRLPRKLMSLSNWRVDFSKVVRPWGRLCLIRRLPLFKETHALPTEEPSFPWHCLLLRSHSNLSSADSTVLALPSPFQTIHRVIGRLGLVNFILTLRSLVTVH